MKTFMPLIKIGVALTSLLVVVACGSKGGNAPVATAQCYPNQGYQNQTYAGGVAGCGQGAFAGGFSGSGYGYGNQGYGGPSIHCEGNFRDVYGQVGYCGASTYVPFCLGYQMTALNGQPVYCAY